MKYGESTFDIFYLIFAIGMGISILKKRKDEIGKLMALATLILGIGDSFHLVPRVLNYFIDANFQVWLGLGKLVTSITMTLFYVLMYHLWLKAYRRKEDRRMRNVIYLLAAVRIFLCLLPQNHWLENEGSIFWGIIRNVPFVILGCIIVWLYFQTRKEIFCLRNVWLLVTLSFLFYIPVAVLASVVPILGMLMLPKTVCYMLLIWAFWKYRD